jgi:hypothetical protein
MKAIIIILTLVILSTTFTSCRRWQIPTTENKHLTVLKRDENLLKTKVRLENKIRIEPITKDTLISSVSRRGKATIKKSDFKVYKIPAKTKGMIVSEVEVGKEETTDTNYYFVFKDKKYRELKLPLNIKKSTIFIRTINKNNIVGTRFIIANNSPGFELRIKEK